MSIKSFEDLKEMLLPNTYEAAISLGFKELTPVQSAVIPNMLKNTDLLVEACTGSGKTLSYLIPLLNKIELLNEDYFQKICAIILLPVRELAEQIYRILDNMLEKYTDISCSLLIGGKDIVEDKEALRQIKNKIVVVATPGRLNELMSAYSKETFKNVEILILDEADMLLVTDIKISIEIRVRKDNNPNNKLFT